MKVTQLCLTLCHPMDCSPSGPSVRGILQAKILELVAISFSILDPEKSLFFPQEIGNLLELESKYM